MQKHRRQLPAVQCIKSSAEILFTCLFFSFVCWPSQSQEIPSSSYVAARCPGILGSRGWSSKKKGGSSLFPLRCRTLPFIMTLYIMLYVQTLIPQIIHTFDMIFIYKASHILENRKECNLMASKLYSRHTSWLFFEGPYYFFLSRHTMNDTCGLHNLMAVG